MDADERERFERFVSPGGAGWFIDLVLEIEHLKSDTVGGLPSDDVLAQELAAKWWDIRALSRSARLKWVRAAKIELDHRDAEDRVRRIVEDYESDNYLDSFRVQLDLFAMEIQNAKELTASEREKWCEIAKRAAGGEITKDDLERLRHERVVLAVRTVSIITDGIYFVTSDRETVKIGYASDIAKRLRALQTGSPRPLQLLAVITGDLSTERALHRRFAAFRVQGEWFRLVPEIDAFIGSEKVTADHG